MCWFICPETKGLSMEECVASILYICLVSSKLTLTYRIDILFGAVSAEQRAADIERVLHGQGDGSRLHAS
jgi:hypothetical protein